MNGNYSHRIVNKLKFVSNSISVNLMPLKKISLSTGKNHNSGFLSDEDENDLLSSNPSGMKGISYKVDSISIKMNNNNKNGRSQSKEKDINDCYSGKFVKISMRNKNSYLTETIHLTNNLLWKGNGYIFDNVSPYG